MSRTQNTRRVLSLLAIGAALSGLISAPTARAAGPVVFENEAGDRFIEIGGRIQIQYNRTDPDGGDATDELIFRRLRPYIAGSFTENWYGKIQFDFGKAVDGNEVAIKDAYLRYDGWKNHRLYIGNSKTPFSRAFLTSSKYQQTVERAFVGDHNFGTPDRQMGLRLDGHNDSKKIGWKLAVGAEQHDPDVRRMDFDTPANDQGDWNQGIVYAGRLDFHPFGAMKFSQGDFHTDDLKATVSVAAFGWQNDDDNNPYTQEIGGVATCVNAGKCDLDSSEGFELSAAIRGFGFSADAEYQRVSGDTVDPTFTGGAYRDGTTDLDKLSLEVGYMLPKNHLELVAAWDSLDATNYQDAWTATELGVNYYWNQHNLKLQLNYRIGENVFGVAGDDQDTVLAMMQLLFE